MASYKARISAKISAKDEPARETCRMRLLAPDLASAAHAGHFVNIKLPEAEGLLWRRPYSVHAVDRGAGVIELLFNTAGRGSRALARALPGDELDLIGLLGNTFDYPDDLQEAIVVAGGVGVAPFHLLLQDLADRSVIKTVFYGVASQDRLCCVQEMADLGARVEIATEDGSCGCKGFVTRLLEEHLATSERTGRRLYVCGPTAMMKAVQDLAAQYGIPGQVTVENRMACGFGACMGCPVERTKSEPGFKHYSLACKDGPVFPLDGIILHD
ncbi:MAG TPA: dihydroorotate dehydrogenase electron transfer subunit [bacterium]|nr:dihydroorotate dehydrogenase electron transfer subunit [bacterium]